MGKANFVRVLRHTYFLAHKYEMTCYIEDKNTLRILIRCIQILRFYLKQGNIIGYQDGLKDG